MKINTAAVSLRTHEEARAKHITFEQQLRRSVMSCLLWEKDFYESGQTIANRIADLVSKVDPLVVSDIAIEARIEMNLRHVPLLLACELARKPKAGSVVSKTLFAVIRRADELTEFLAIYWRKGKCPLSSQVKKGLAAAFVKFDGYQLAKYNRDGAVKLRDVLFLCHAKPKDSIQAMVWKNLVNGTLPAPDTWEVALSAPGADKREVWDRMLSEKKLGALALLRNLRNMLEAGITRPKISKALEEMRTERVLPFRFIAAAREVPTLEPVLEEAMLRAVQGMTALQGETILLVDISGSMTEKISAKSDLTRVEAAAALAILLREVCPAVRIMVFNGGCAEIPARRGFALRDLITKCVGGGTDIGHAVRTANAQPHSRLIVITDEQSATPVSDPMAPEAYMINVASAQHGVGYGKWTHLDGFSEAIIGYIQASQAFL